MKKTKQEKELIAITRAQEWAEIFGRNQKRRIFNKK